MQTQAMVHSENSEFGKISSRSGHRRVPPRLHSFRCRDNLFVGFILVLTVSCVCSGCSLTMVVTAFLTLEYPSSCPALWCYLILDLC